MSYRVYLTRKLSGLVVTVLLIATLNFFLFQVLPGDPTRVLIPRGGGSATNVTELEGLRQQLTREWGLDRPVYERFGIYFVNLILGNWGTSITLRPGSSVWAVIIPALSTTLVFMGTATLISIWIGMRLGQFSGWRRGKLPDTGISLVSLVLYSMPTFWMAFALIYVLAVYVPILPVGGEANYPAYYGYDFFGKVADRILHLVLPVLTFVLNNYAIFTLIMRNSLVEELSEDYMTTARAKGLSPLQQLLRHAIPNARLPVATVVALYVGWILSGAIVIEVVFDLNGLGALTWDAVTNRDFPLLSAIFLLGTFGVVVANTILDIAYSYIDPRVTEA